MVLTVTPSPQPPPREEREFATDSQGGAPESSTQEEREELSPL